MSKQSWSLAKKIVKTLHEKSIRVPSATMAKYPSVSTALQWLIVCCMMNDLEMKFITIFGK